VTWLTLPERNRLGRQVTISIEIREQLGPLANTEVEFEVVGKAVRIRKVRRPAAAGRRGKSIAQVVLAWLREDE